MVIITVFNRLSLKKKKNVVAGGGNPFQNIEKTTVLQEARTFNETPVNPRKCTHILTKILYLLNQVCVFFFLKKVIYDSVLL